MTDDPRDTCTCTSDGISEGCPLHGHLAGDTATPTTMRWKLEHFAGGTILYGIEWPVKVEHNKRLAGKQIYDCGEFRELRSVNVELPANVVDAIGWAKRLEEERHGTVQEEAG